MSALVLVALLGCGSGQQLELEPDPVEAAVLDDEAYRFCHEPGVDAEAAQEWCELLEGVPESRCPGLRETCAGAPPVESSGCDSREQGGSAGRAPAGSPSAPSRPWRSKACELPDGPAAGLASLVRWFAALAVALMVLVAIRLIWHSVGSRSVPEVEPLPVVPEEAPQDEILEGVPDLPSLDLLAAARAALEAGDHGKAVVLARGAALRRLGDLGKVRLHRSRTDREYVRAVRKDADLQGALREVLGAVEIFRWGGARLDQERSRSAVAAADRILKAVGVALLVFGLGLGDARAQDERYGLFGDAALLDVLRAWGHDAVFRLRGLDSLDSEVDVVILDTTFVMPDESGWAALRTWVENGGILVVAGHAEFDELGLREAVLAGTPVERTERVRDLLLPLPRWPEGPQHAFVGGIGDPWVRLVPEQGPDTPTETRSVVVGAAVGGGWVLGIADPRVIWNGAFVDPANEQFVGDLPNAVGGALGWASHSPLRIELATTAAASSPTPTQSILNADLLPFVVQLMLTWALLGLWVGWPFAPLRDPPEEGRLAFADHVRALATRWQRMGASRYALAAYGSLWLGRLGHDGVRSAALRAGRDRHRADALISALDAAVADPTGPDSEHDLEWMEELWTITQNR